MKTKNKNRLLCLCEGALVIASAYVLELLCVWLNAISGVGALLPFGGTISVSILPIVYYSYRRGIAWGAGVGFAYSLLQMALGFYVPPANKLWALILCVLLDYVIAFTVVGVADVFAKPFGKRKIIGYTVGGVAVCIVRFISSFISGVILWGSYAPEGMNVWIYSLVYNASYMIPNTVLTGILAALICMSLNPKTLKPMKRA